MNSPSTMRLLLVLALLLATVVPSTVAGKVKGLKGSSASVRALKEEKEGKKGKKVSGPSSRRCVSSSKDKEATVECRSDPDLKAKGSKGEAVSEEKADKADKGDKASDKGEPKETESAAAEPLTEASEEEDDSSPESRGINLTPSDEIKDKIKYVVKTSKDGIQVAIKYKQEFESSANKTETEFELLFESIVEYVKGTPTQRFGDGVITEAFNWDTDEIVQTIALSDWDGMLEINHDAEGLITFFTATATLGSSDVDFGPTGTTSFNFTVAEAEMGERITANTMKIDVRILNFPWARSDSYIALMSNVKSQKKVHLEFDDEAAVSGGKSKLTQDVYVALGEEMHDLGLEAFGEYTWVHSAVVSTADDIDDEDSGAFDHVNSDVAVGRKAGGNTGTDSAGNNTLADDDFEGASSTTIEVVATSPEEQSNENYQQIAYSFVGDSAHSAKDIYWDPEAGIGYGEAASAAWAVSISWVSALAGALLYLVW